jgi:hypothetical protein
MRSFILLIIVFFSFVPATYAQTYFTKNGKISFFSKTTLENIDAANNQAVSVINSNTGNIAFSVLISGFIFKKALMQEHFNENYLESSKYPKATFNGKITDLTKINFTKDGVYNVSVTGDLLMHGVAQKATTAATITVSGKKLTANSVFTVLVGDYNISIPKLVEDNISKTIQIKVDCKYDPK